MEEFGSISVIRLIYIIEGCSGFRGERVIREFSFKYLYARLVVVYDWIDVEDCAKEGVYSENGVGVGGFDDVMVGDNWRMVRV